MRSRPSITRRRRSSSSQTSGKENRVVKGFLLKILFEPLGQGFEHAGVRGELLALARDDLLRGPLDELLVRELVAGTPDLGLEARDLLFETFNFPATKFFAQNDLDHHVPGRQCCLRRAVE